MWYPAGKWEQTICSALKSPEKADRIKKTKMKFWLEKVIKYGPSHNAWKASLSFFNNPVVHIEKQVKHTAPPHCFSPELCIRNATFVTSKSSKTAQEPCIPKSIHETNFELGIDEFINVYFLKQRDFSFKNVRVTFISKFIRDKLYVKLLGPHQRWETKLNKWFKSPEVLLQMV